MRFQVWTCSWFLCGFFTLTSALTLGVHASPVETARSKPWEPLLRIQQAADRLNYSGVFVYQAGDTMRSSRILHLMDRSGVHEKLEMLDGKPREYIRHNDELFAYRPDRHMVIIEKYHARKHFPGVSLTLGPDLEKYYTLKSLTAERVAGMECDGWLLDARDTARYSYRLCAETQTGLLLKIETLGEQGTVLEHSVFTEVHIGGVIERQKIKTGFTGSEHWQQVQYPVDTVNFSAQGWVIPVNVPGFNRIHELQRHLPGQPETGHIVLSDGISAVSIFIRHYQEDSIKPDGVLRQGAIHAYTRRIGNYAVTVLGDVPAATVKTIAQSIEFKPVK